MAQQGTLERLLEVERGEIGYDRYKDPETGTKYGRWYAKKTGQAWYGANGVAYCAMFQSYCLAMAGVTAVGIPGAYTPTIQNAVRSAHKQHRAAQAKTGDLVLFDWGDNVERETDGPEHIGFVEYNNGRYLTCIEGNTNNGKVARRYRSYGSVTVCWTPDYKAASSAPTASASKPATSPAASKPAVTPLKVDGLAGYNTIGRAQDIAGTGTDHYISDQLAWICSQPNARATGVWHRGDGKHGGSALVKAIQKALNEKHGWKLDVDGLFGLVTWHHFEEHYGIDPDDRVDSPSATFKCWQRALNSGKLI